MTQEELKALLDYDPESGVFTWKVKISDKINVGQRAGSNAVKGYRQLKLNGTVYNEHRLVWFYNYGIWPTEIDHINQVKSDNRLVNLREVSRVINAHNKSKANSTSSIGLRGVRFDKNKYTATIQVAGILHRLGRFDTAEQAHQAYLNSKTELLGM